MPLHPIFDLVPSLYTMEIFEFQDGDPNYQHTRHDGSVVPMGITLASLQQQFDDDEGDYTSPTGETYHISLAPWNGKERTKTWLHMTFHATPLLPADIAPELLPSPLTPSPSLPQSQPGTAPSSTPPVARAASPVSPIRPRGSALGAPPSNDYILCSDVRREHRIKIQRSRNSEVGIPADTLLNLPEAAMTEILCPVCAAPIRLMEPFAKRLQQGIAMWGAEAKVQLVFDHPVDIEETRTPPTDSPFVVHRYWRYHPISLPTRQKDPDVELSVLQKTHDHLIMLTANAGETTARTLLALPEAQQSILHCPLCAERLPVAAPFGTYIRVLADNAEGDDTRMRWSISHPAAREETKVPSEQGAILAVRHADDNEFMQKPYDDSIEFVLRKRTPA